MFAATLQCTLAVSYSDCTTIKTDSTNNDLFSDFLCVSSTSTNGAVIRRIVMLAAPVLIDRSMTNYCALEEKEIELIQDAAK